MADILKTIRIDETVTPAFDALSRYYGSDGVAAEHAFKNEYTRLVNEGKIATALRSSDQRRLLKRAEALKKLNEFLIEVDEIFIESSKKNEIDEHFTRTVAAKIATTPAVRKVYDAAVDALGPDVVNQQLGRRCKALTGWESHEQAKATGPAGDIIRSYTRLRPEPKKR